MPSGKPRDFEDTWKPEELQKSLKGSSSRKDKDKRDRDKEKDRDRRKDRDKETDKGGEKRRKDDEKDGHRRERRHREKENGEVEKPREKHRDRDRDREKPRRDKDEGKDRDKRERRHKDEDKEKRRKHDDDGKERRHRDKDGEGRHKERGGDEKRRRHRDENDVNEEERPRRNRDDRSERRKHREEEAVNGEREEKREERRKRDGEKDKEEKRERRDGERRRHRETSEERRERKKRERAEEEKRKKEEEERKAKEKQLATRYEDCVPRQNLQCQRLDARTQDSTIPFDIDNVISHVALVNQSTECTATRTSSAGDIRERCSHSPGNKTPVDVARQRQDSRVKLGVDQSGHSLDQYRTHKSDTGTPGNPIKIADSSQQLGSKAKLSNVSRARALLEGRLPVKNSSFSNQSLSKAHSVFSSTRQSGPLYKRTTSTKSSVCYSANASSQEQKRGRIFAGTAGSAKDKCKASISSPLSKRTSVKKTNKNTANSTVARRKITPLKSSREKTTSKKGTSPVKGLSESEPLESTHLLNGAAHPNPLQSAESTTLSAVITNVSRKEESKTSVTTLHEEDTPDEENIVTSSSSSETLKEENGGNDYDYEDDFEDYDDDFEDDDDEQQNEDEASEDESRGEVDEVLRAMNEENERLVRQANEGWQEEPDSRDRKRPTTASGGNFINFQTAKQRAVTNKAASKAKQRGVHLLQIIDLDKAAFDLFDMPPVNEYEMYMRSFGQSNTKQAYVQTNDDNIDREIQTEEIETTEKWTQHPGEEIRVCGGGNTEEDDFQREMKPTDTLALSKFLTKAGLVMAILLEESQAESSEREDKKKSNIYISEAFTPLTLPAFIQGRPVLSSHFSATQTNSLLTVHGPPKKASEDDQLSTQGFTCVWNLNEPSAPKQILVCESQPKCCCFSPVKATLAFAGMSEGSVAVWDLREATSQHRKHTQGDREWCLRYPTYNTAGVLHYENHQSPVCSVAAIAGPASSGVTSGTEESGLSFQLASVEENSVVHLWVVAEMSRADYSGSESDLGLAPGGKVKLIRSSTITLENPLRDTRLRTVMKSSELQLLPSDPSHFYVATNTGCVLHGVRYGGRAPPRAYRPDDDSQLGVTSIDFSPFPPNVFLAGCSDGSLRLYVPSNELPVCVWPRATDGGRAVHTVRWCRSRPSVFFVLDSASHLYTWDLLMSQTEALKTERVSEHRVTSIALSNDHSATGLGVPGRRPQLMFGLSTGEVEVHTLSQKFSALIPDEPEQFQQVLSTLL